MPTRRMIDPAIWQSESMASLTRDQRLLFIGLFSNADDQGRLRGSVHLIRSTVFPFDDIGIEEIKGDLRAIEAEGSIALYEVDGKDYIQVAHWWDYQSPQWAYPSKYPAMPGWYDRLRYRKDNSVITCNWKPDHSDYIPPPDSPDEPPLPPQSPNGLPKPLPNDLGKSQGGPIELVLGLEIENKEEIESRAMLAQVSSFYQQEIGPISPLIRDKLLELCTSYPAEWIKLAISGAVEQNARKISYVRGTLENWQAVGGPQNDKPKGQYGNGNGPHQKRGSPSSAPDPPRQTEEDRTRMAGLTAALLDKSRG